MHRECVVLPNVKLRSAGETPANLVYNSKILDTNNCYTILSVLHQTLNLCSENTEALTIISSRVHQTFQDARIAINLTVDDSQIDIHTWNPYLVPNGVCYSMNTHS